MISFVFRSHGIEKTQKLRAFGASRMDAGKGQLKRQTFREDSRTGKYQLLTPNKKYKSMVNS
jgi:hypothetical protein